MEKKFDIIKGDVLYFTDFTKLDTHLRQFIVSKRILEYIHGSPFKLPQDKLLDGKEHPINYITDYRRRIGLPTLVPHDKNIINRDNVPTLLPPDTEFSWSEESKWGKRFEYPIAVIGDIHGNPYAIDLMEDLKAKGLKIISVGDVIDNGVYGIDVLLYMVMNGVEMIIGNHEIAFIKDLKPTLDPSRLITYINYAALPSETRNKLIKYIEDAPFYLFNEDFVITHAKIRSDFLLEIPLNEFIYQDSRAEYTPKFGRTLIHGHLFDEGSPKRINLDQPAPNKIAYAIIESADGLKGQEHTTNYFREKEKVLIYLQDFVSRARKIENAEIYVSGDLVTAANHDKHITLHLSTGITAGNVEREAIYVDQNDFSGTTVEAMLSDDRVIVKNYGDAIMAKRRYATIVAKGETQTSLKANGIVYNNRGEPIIYPIFVPTTDAPDGEVIGKVHVPPEFIQCRKLGVSYIKCVSNRSVKYEQKPPDLTNVSKILDKFTIYLYYDERWRLIRLVRSNVDFRMKFISDKESPIPGVEFDDREDMKVIQVAEKIYIRR